VIVELKTIGIVSITQPLHHEQGGIFLTKWPFSRHCVMSWDRIFDWRHKSSSRSVAARISQV